MLIQGFELQRKNLLIALAVVVIVVIVGTSSWVVVNPNQPEKTPQVTGQEQVRDAAMSYIQTNHPQTAQLMTNLAWTGGRQVTGLVGAETYSYNSTDWAVIIEYPVVPNPIYTINATYSSADLAVAWQGTYQNGSITEANYTYTP